MPTIIVPIDFSQESLTGLNMALVLALKSKSTIQMIHVVANNSDTIKTQSEEYLAIVQKFENIIGDYKKMNISEISLSYAIKTGKIFKEVVRLAEKESDSLIVLSTHGASGFEENFIGGDAFKIVSHSKCPVITIRRGAFATHIHKIVLPLDIDFQTREKVPFTLRLAQMFNSELHLLTINTSKSIENEQKLFQYAHQVAAYIKKQNIPLVEKHLHGPNFTDLTLEYAYSINANLVSIMTEQNESFSNLIMGSYAHQMINKAIIPVLIFPIFPISNDSEGFRTSGSSY